MSVTPLRRGVTVLSVAAGSIGSVIERMFLDPRLETMAPGPELGVVLATIDRSRLNGYDLVIVMAARARQVCYEQAQLLADTYEVSRCEPGGPHAPVERTRTIGSEQDEFAAA